MQDRESQINEFIGRAGWAGADRRSLFADASRRRYERLTKRGGEAKSILMDAPVEDCGPLQPFKSATAFLRGLSLSAPEIYAVDDSLGLMLLEDLGDDLVARVLERSPELEDEIYETAVDVLAEMRQAGDPSGFPVHSPELQAELAALAIDWYLPAATGREPPAGLREEFCGIVRELIEGLGAPSVFAHRDYHAENIIWLPERSGLQRVGLLDYQDGSIGYRTYDLVSLLEDARRDLPEALRERLAGRFARAAGAEKSAIDQELAVCGAQRNLRIVGVFARLAIRDGKRGYLKLIPRVWGHLQLDLSSAGLEPLARFVERRLPVPDHEARAGIAARSA